MQKDVLCVDPFSMSYRPSTAQSAISSELSDDEDVSKTKSKLPSPLSQSSAPPDSSGTQLRAPTTLSALVTRNNARSGTSTTASSRPDSPVSHVSKSHVPSLAAQGFFRPMSSQHLQAQRLGRPGTAKTRPSISTEDGTRDFETDTRRSLSTIRQERQGSFPPVQEQENVPLSRGIEVSVPPLPDRATNASQRGNTSRSLGDSVRLLNERTSSQRQSKPTHLDLPNVHTQGDSGDPSLKSPRSFPSGLSLGSKRGSSRQQIGAGHQHLPSNATSTRFDSTQNPTVVPETASPGKNYEYFAGNTVFFWGGRLQNARDRPVNIATGILLVLPAVLFLAISSVLPTLSSLVRLTFRQRAMVMAKCFPRHPDRFRLPLLHFLVFVYTCFTCGPWSTYSHSNPIAFADLPGLSTKPSPFSTTRPRG